MLRYFRSPFGAESHRQSVKQVSVSNAVGFGTGIGLSSGRVAEVHQAEPRRSQAEQPNANSVEMKVWAVVFALIILATITLIVVILMEEPGHVHAALSHRSWIASSPFLFFS
jgi:hypothetical protein